MNKPAAAFKMPESFTGYLPPYPLRQMTEDECKVLVALMMLPEEKYQVATDLATDQAYQILTRRLKAYNVPVDVRCILFCLQPFKSPGELVVMAWTLAKVYSIIKREVKIGDLLDHGWAEGVPDVEHPDAHKLWQSQKGVASRQDCDNLIDCAPWPHQEGA